MNILSYYIILLLTIIFKLFIKLDKNMINAAILGLGWWGKHITETLSKSSLIQIKAACSRTKEKHTQFIEEHNLKYYKNYIDLLSDNEIDAIIICTPNSQHEEQALMAIDAKKQVLDLRKNGFEVSTIDLGGGIGIKYNEKSRIVDVEMYTNLIEELFSDMKLEIIIEPGRYIVGSSGIILTRVIRVKKGKDKNFLILDAGMNNLLRPALYGAKHSIFPVKLSSKRKVLYDIVGPICESSDVFMKNAKIQELNKDDLVVISSTGAYSSCMASDYNLRPKAQEVFVKEKIWG